MYFVQQDWIQMSTQVFHVNIGLDRLVMMRYGVDDVRLFPQWRFKIPETVQISGGE